MTGAVIRRYRQEELQQLIRLAGASREGSSPFGDTRDHSGLLAYVVTDDSFEIFVAEVGGRQAGFGVLRKNGEPGAAGGSGMIYDVFVAPAARGSGVGTALLKYMMEESAKSGYRTVRLMVNADNAAAIALYRKLGFQIRRLEMAYESGHTEL
ncbi:N-acetyltransferase [Paenibacillus sp. J31TS4]|uniref:GNAT family N-acetyltransferase n=1 Tax=Paenibacillus sp. J31TS4 TaxID=2807195 RepID=UPI001B15F734|nr:GNAT family N-acetyltransferase [Paenibacillus sp. J31TS4]GIP37763.1 N-acetyltransferase [Paenibacillus sp. J31TS4]